LGEGVIKGMAHITGGGLTENVPRMMPEGRLPRIDRTTWKPPALFEWLQRGGGVSDDEMFRAFNMGVGLVMACAPEHETQVLSMLAASGEAAWRVGEVVQGIHPHQ